eukprot:1422473-Rhodomonas_salina.1
MCIRDSSSPPLAVTQALQVGVYDHIPGHLPYPPTPFLRYPGTDLSYRGTDLSYRATPSPVLA